MAYLLLSAENLAVALLLVATVVACTAHWKRQSVARLVSAVALLAPLAFYGALATVTGILRYDGRVETGWFWPLIVLGSLYVIGAAVIRVRAGRDGASNASGWPRRRLATALAVVFVLHLMTGWNIDTSVCQGLSIARAEASAMALAVAPTPIANRDNAAPLYERAHAAFEQDQDGADAWGQITGGEWREADPSDPSLFTGPVREDVRAFLERHERELDVLRDAVKKPGCYWKNDYSDPSLDVSMPEALDQMQCARALRASAAIHAAAGDIDGALRDAAALFTLSDHVRRGGWRSLIQLLVGAAIDAMAVEELQSILRSHEPAVAQLESIRADPTVFYQQEYVRTLQMEEAAVLITLSSLAAGDGGWLSVVAAMKGDDRYRRGWLEAIATPFYRVLMLPDDIAAYRTSMRGHRSRAAMGFHEAQREFGNFYDRWPKRSRMSVALVGPSYDGCFERITGADAHRRVYETALAMHFYRASHGKYPQRLDTLVPEFLEPVPGDPFDGKPLKLRTTDAGWIVYSVGPDETDDGGRPYDRETKEGDFAFRFERDE